MFLISIWECLQDQDPSLLKLQQISKKPPTAMKSTGNVLHISLGLRSYFANEKNEKMQKRLVYPKPVNSSLNIGAIGWLKHSCLKKRISFPEAFQLICFVLLKHPKCIRWTNLNRIEERIQSGCFFSALRTIRGCNLVQSSAHWNSVFDPPDQLRLGGISL